ncbi:S1 RNA-binding domain-containing protein [Streptococcus pneumoniae]|nr:S1 RNA-binding domain-containing protein [Streptococcus pneumoniae]
MILFENLFKPGQLHLAVDMLTSSVLSATSKQCSVLSTTSKQCVLSATSKQCFEQPVTSFLIDALIFIAYNQKEKFSPEKHIE